MIRFIVVLRRRTSFYKTFGVFNVVLFIDVLYYKIPSIGPKTRRAPARAGIERRLIFTSTSALDLQVDVHSAIDRSVVRRSAPSWLLAPLLSADNTDSTTLKKNTFHTAFTRQLSSYINVRSIASALRPSVFRPFCPSVRSSVRTSPVNPFIHMTNCWSILWICGRMGRGKNEGIRQQRSIRQITSASSTPRDVD